MEDLSETSLVSHHVEDTLGARPYPPSYMDRFMEAVRRIPGPYWIPYLALFLLLAAVNHALAWADGWLSAPQFNSLLLVFPIWICLPPAIMTYLNAASREVLTSFSPLLELEPPKLSRLKYEFTTMPARGVFLSGTAWCAIFLLLASISARTWAQANGASVTFVLFMVLEGVISFLTGGSAIFYHSIRQLTLVNRTVKLVQRFDLFRLDPVYAFSRLTARTGAAWLVLLSLNLLTFPFEITGRLTVGLYVLLAGLALAVFVLPLQFVRRRLVAEKRRLLVDLDRRLESLLGRFHRALDEAHMAEMDQFHHAFAALNAERDALNRIPTLPWRGVTLSAFLSAILLPLVLFVLQTIIARWMGR